jgi:hypothetical protein
LRKHVHCDDIFIVPLQIRIEARDPEHEARQGRQEALAGCASGGKS